MASETSASDEQMRSYARMLDFTCAGHTLPLHVLKGGFWHFAKNASGYTRQQN